MPTFKTKLQGDARLTAHVATIPSPVVTQAMAASGADAAIIDLEHGAVDYGTAHAMIASLQGTDCAPLIRITEIDEAQVKRVLDLGAEGVVFPLVRTVADAQRAVASMHYPPKGTRGFGPFIAHSHYDTSLPGYQAAVEPHLVCCLLVETRDAVANIEDIAAVPGVDLLVPAQFDLTTDLGISGQFDHPDYLAALAKIESAAKAAGVPLGQAALNKDQAEAAFARGYRLIAGFDVLWLKGAATAAQSWCD